MGLLSKVAVATGVGFLCAVAVWKSPLGDRARKAWSDLRARRTLKVVDVEDDKSFTDDDFSGVAIRYDKDGNPENVRLTPGSSGIDAQVAFGEKELWVIQKGGQGYTAPPWTVLRVGRSAYRYGRQYAVSIDFSGDLGSWAGGRPPELTVLGLLPQEDDPWPDEIVVMARRFLKEVSDHNPDELEAAMERLRDVLNRLSQFIGEDEG